MFIEVDSAVPKLAYALLRRGALIFGLFLLFFAPLSRDPIPFAAGAMIPFLLMLIVGTRNMPASSAYLRCWQWVEVFAQVLLSSVSGEAVGEGIYGPNVAR